MRSRLLASGLLVVLGCSVLPVSMLASDATDFLADAGAIDRDNAGNDGELITRGDVLKILLDGREDFRNRVNRYRGRLSKLPLYLDIERGDEIAPYAEAAFALRITSGFSDRTLRPNDPIPAEEAITLLMRAYRQPGESAPGDAAWYAPFIRTALRKNIVANPRAMRIGQPVTRGQFHDMAYRMGAITRDDLASFPQPVRIVEQNPGRGASAGAVTQQQPGIIGSVQVARPTEDQGALEQYRSSQNFAISIPSLDIRDLQVTHPDDPQSKEGQLAPLQNGVGHLYSYPGRGGKIMIYGHSSGYSWDVSQYTKIFQQVNKLKKGDKVFVTFDGKLYEYEVTGQQKITPNDKTPFSGDGEELILYTCWPVGSNKSRLIIRAVPVETVAVR
ncbi:MAG: sortase [Candidatus Peribacteraceae bacterium]|nr:sortase [Candidatus Peribacteraceae bacterium]